jgi:hypothetical protein
VCPDILGTTSRDVDGGGIRSARGIGRDRCSGRRQGGSSGCGSCGVESRSEGCTSQGGEERYPPIPTTFPFRPIPTTWSLTFRIGDLLSLPIEQTVSTPTFDSNLDTTDSEPFTSAVGQAFVDSKGLVEVVGSVQGALLGISTALDVIPALGS